MSFSAGVFNINSTGQPVVTGTVISSTVFNALTADLASGLSTCVLKDGTQTLTANIPMAGFKLTGLGAGTAAGNSVRWEQSAVGVVTAKGDTVVASASGAITNLAVGSNGQALVANSNATNGIQWSIPVIRSYLAGCGMSTAGSSATMSIAAGVAADSTNVDMITLAAIAKTTSAWAVGTGNGGLDTGSIANSTWYHFYAIKRVDTGVTDVLFSLSASAPTMPTNYTLKRRIGAGFVNGSTQWALFTQDGDYFRWSASVLDVNSNNPGANQVTATLASVPSGISVLAFFNGGFLDTASATKTILFSDLSAANETPSQSAAPLVSFSGYVANFGAYIPMQIRTNTSGQIGYKLSASDANTTVRIATLGWFDTRGRNA